MSDELDENLPLKFMAATVVRPDLVFIAAQVLELNARGVDHTKVLRWKDGAWAHYMLDWPSIAIEHLQLDKLAVFNLGLDGQVHVASGALKRVESIDDSVERPENRGPLREMRAIHGQLHAVGMQRQAYRRVGDAAWQRIDQGAVLPLQSKDIESFDSIDGFDAQDLYAVGMNGAIWHRRGETWSAVDSPTSVWLKKVLCVQGTVYAAGQMGTLLCGRDDAWQVLDTEGLQDTIWDLRWFRDALYVATTAGLHRWAKGQFEQVDLGLPGDGRFACLAGNDEVLWCIGRSRLSMTSDGVVWVDVTCTDGSY